MRGEEPYGIPTSMDRPHWALGRLGSRLIAWVQAWHSRVFGWFQCEVGLIMEMQSTPEPSCWAPDLLRRGPWQVKQAKRIAKRKPRRLDTLQSPNHRSLVWWEEGPSFVANLLTKACFLFAFLYFRFSVTCESLFYIVE